MDAAFFLCELCTCHPHPPCSMNSLTLCDQVQCNTGHLEHHLVSSTRAYMASGNCFLLQEAVCVGMESSITKDDAVITAYRAHGWTYVRGVAPHSILGELTGRQMAVFPMSWRVNCMPRKCDLHLIDRTTEMFQFFPARFVWFISFSFDFFRI